MFQQNDSICAISTGSVEAAIAVVRLSGENSLDIISKCFQAKDEKRFEKAEAYRLYFGSFMDGEDIVDQVLLSLFKVPNSYTGENMVEISCHGSLYIQQRILDVLLSSGARMAEPGEFTRRAFLNGKMELNQAEAVADLISSDSKASHELAIRQMKNGFSEEISVMRAKLLKLVSMMELELDFSEEDVQFADRTELLNLLTQVNDRILSLLEGFRYGNVLKHGMPVVIAGKPNVGKSTLLNALLKEDRAIVSDIPGTTRDSLEDDMVIDGLRFRFIDTAGLRETGDEIEGKGIKRAYEKLEKAGIVLLMSEMGDENEDVFSLLKDVKSRLKDKTTEVLLLLNKSDIQPSSSLKNEELFELYPKLQIFSLSAKTGKGMSDLLEAMVMSVRGMKGNADIILSNMRHVEALKDANQAAERAKAALLTGIPSDLVSQDIREVLHHLGLITGEITTDEVLGNIFKNFCIGK